MVVGICSYIIELGPHAKFQPILMARSRDRLDSGISP